MDKWRSSYHVPTFRYFNIVCLVLFGLVIDIALKSFDLLNHRDSNSTKLEPELYSIYRLHPTMASCHNEHEHGHGGDGHGHDHSHGHDGHDHSHDLEPALRSNLYQQINFEAIRTLNETESQSGAGIVQKTWDERLNDTPVLESDADEQLLMHIP